MTLIGETLPLLHADHCCPIPSPRIDDLSLVPLPRFRKSASSSPGILPLGFVPLKILIVPTSSSLPFLDLFIFPSPPVAVSHGSSTPSSPPPHQPVPPQPRCHGHHPLLWFLCVCHPKGSRNVAPSSVVGEGFRATTCCSFERDLVRLDAARGSDSIDSIHDMVDSWLGFEASSSIALVNLPPSIVSPLVLGMRFQNYCLQNFHCSVIRPLVPSVTSC